MSLLGLRHSLSVWTSPLYREGLTSETVVLGALVRAVHAWIPEAQPNRKSFRWRVGPGNSGAGENLESGEQFNVHEFEAVFEIIL